MSFRAISTIGVVAVVLFATNPTIDDYVGWVRQQVPESGPAGEHMLGKALFSLIGGPIVSVSTARGNFYLFSIFTTQLDASNRFVAIGVLRNFIPISGLTAGSQTAPAPHVVPGGTEGRWLPEDGYVWVVNPPVPGDLRVRWEPGRLSSQHAHVIAADAEGRWLPEDGYVWIATPPKPGDFSVRWEPGRLSSQHAHVIAADAEGRWLPEDGYVWIVSPPKPGDFSVRWEPGRLSTKHPHVVAADIEGRWRPEGGYMWVVNPPVAGDLRVRSVGP